MPHTAHTDSGEAVHNTGDTAPLRSHARVHPLTLPRTGTHARAHSEGKDGSVGVEHIAPKAPPTEHTGGQGPRGLSLLAPLALPSSPLILPSCLLSGWGPGAHFNGSVAWGFSLVSHYPPGWGCHGPETKGQHAGNRTAKTFWGQRKDNSLFWERLM